MYELVLALDKLQGLGLKKKKVTINQTLLLIAVEGGRKDI